VILYGFFHIKNPVHSLFIFHYTDLNINHMTRR